MLGPRCMSPVFVHHLSRLLEMQKNQCQCLFFIFILYMLCVYLASAFFSPVGVSSPAAFLLFLRALLFKNN
jgi:hypothetical protein